MIFQHAETGIRVKVHESTVKINHKRLDGTVVGVGVFKELTTESGQRCIPATIDDVHGLLSIDILTSGGKVRLVRFE